MTSLRLTAALLVAVAMLVATAAVLTRMNHDLRGEVADHKACADAVGRHDLAAIDGRCEARVAAAARQAVQAETCDRALLAGELFVQRAACSTEVKTLAAGREAETRRADSLAEALAQERAGLSAAITRAETRARTETERKLRAEAVIQDAPRRDGLLVLDAERLRRLGADAAADR